VDRFKVDVPAKASASLPVEEVRVLQTSYQLADPDDDQIALFIRNGTVTPAMAEALKKIAAQKAVVAKLETDMENRQKDIDRIVADQLLQRYTRELDEQETQLDTLRKTIQDTEAQRDKASDALHDIISKRPRRLSLKS